ncbi:MAG: AI-2E family transporter [Acidobacteriota bacterium]
MAADESGSTPRVSLDERDEQEGLVPVSARSGALTIVSTVLAIYFLQWAQQLLIPVVLAVLISFVLTPLVNAFYRLVWRSVASALAIALATGALGVGVWAVSDDAIAVVRDVPEAARRVRTLVRQHRNSRGGTLQQVQQAAAEIEKTANAAAPDSARPPSDVQRVQIVNPAFKASDYLWGGGMGVVGFLGQLVMIFFLAYFLLSSGDLYKRKLVRIAGPTLSHRKVTIKILEDISEQIARFLVTQLATSAVVGALTAVALWWQGLDSWLFWGIMAGILNSIPYFGPVIVSAALAVVAFLQFGTLGRTLAVTGIAFAITSLEGFLITPALMGKAARMNPAAVFVGLLFWGWIWGMWGVILAVPMMMLIKSVCDHVEDFAAVGELLGE